MKKIVFILLVTFIIVGLSSCTKESISEDNKLSENTECCGNDDILPPPPPEN